jgi:hypothetical protein
MSGVGPLVIKPISQMGQKRRLASLQVISGYPEQRTSLDRPGWFGSCHEPASTRLFDHVADLPFDDLINYPISRSIAVNGN